MLVGITGTPGTGKTSVTELLESRTSYRVIHINELIKEEKLYSEVDNERDCVVADMDLVDRRVREMASTDDITILDSHLSHHLADSVIVLRTKPEVLRDRLQKRNYCTEKVEENLEAESLDIILCESVEWCDNVFEIDTTSQSVERTLDDIRNILEGLAKGREKELAERYRPGSVDWSEEFFG
ncbi:MAG: adenylate kinase family protein [Methanolobus sp.]|uniref:adenylate kinase family protein n=1 Tax=Methanolobus sp. TaxID=1874737 RepID=UPI002731EE4E|nr:adenylate kinase family protein [Methanolobus sp.]MDP2217507.1 adenylate kinase family protein [Methanolobus sp.]